jgi:hypothetical protein
MGAFLSNLVSTFVGALLAVVVLIFTPQIVDRFAYLDPSCDNPRGLSSLRLNEMYERKQLSIGATSVAEPPSGNPSDLWKEANVIDGNAGTPWVPAEGDRKRRLTLKSFARSGDRCE